MKTKQQIQVKLHKVLAKSYRDRYEPDFSKIFNSYWMDGIVRELAHVSYDAHVLDLGCGTGVMLTALGRRFRAVFGLDLSADMVRQVEVEHATKVVLGDATRLPFETESLDAVVCRSVLHHAPSMLGVLEEVWRVLKPDGSLVLSEPCNDSAPVRLARKLLYKWSSKFDESDLGFYSSDLAESLEKVGFSKIRFRRFGFLSYLFAGFPDVLGILLYIPGRCLLTRLFIRIDRFFADVPRIRDHSFHIILSARKLRTPE